MQFMRALEQAWKIKNTLLCVGLDPDPARMPEQFRSTERPLFHFARAIIDATADLVCAYKPQIAYYAAIGAEDELEQTIRYIHEAHPGIPVILDAKRGDIGSTAERYAQEAFERYGADAVTVNPYMGTDALAPFLAWKEKGVVILCRTSNPGARDVQDLVAGGGKIYRIIAEKAAAKWNAHGNVLLVAGATFPEELREIRGLIGDMPLLVPGIGAQGGDVGAVMRAGMTARGDGLLINSARGILYAGRDGDFAAAARKAALDLRDEINRHRSGV